MTAGRRNAAACGACGCTLAQARPACRRPRGIAAGRLGHPYLWDASTLQDAIGASPFARLVYPPTARIAPPPYSYRPPSLSPLPPPSFLIPRACATLGNGRCVAVPEGWAGRGSDAPMRLRPNDATGRAWRWAGRGSDAPMRADRAEGRAVMPIRRPDRRMKIEGWIYQYLPLSGIRPMPSRSKCLSSSSIHLSRLSL